LVGDLDFIGDLDLDFVGDLDRVSSLAIILFSCFISFFSIDFSRSGWFRGLFEGDLERLGLFVGLRDRDLDMASSLFFEFFEVFEVFEALEPSEAFELTESREFERDRSCDSIGVCDRLLDREADRDRSDIWRSEILR